MVENCPATIDGELEQAHHANEGNVARSFFVLYPLLVWYRGFFRMLMKSSSVIFSPARNSGLLPCFGWCKQVFTAPANAQGGAACQSWHKIEVALGSSSKMERLVGAATC